MSTTTVSVGIPAYNEEKNIQPLLEHLLTQKQTNFILKEIIVVSDCSTDRTDSIVTALRSPLVTLIKNTKRLGQALTQNRIVEKFDSDVLVLLNADVLPADDFFLDELIKPFLENPNLGMVCPLIVPVKPRSFFEKILFFSTQMKQALFTSWNQGRTLYSCVGRARAFSRQFAKAIRWPELTAEDAFSYLSCLELGYQFTTTHTAVITYKLPVNLVDHTKQSGRFMTGPEEMSQFFAPEFVRQQYGIPPLLGIQTTGRFFIRHPILCLAYFSLLLRIFYQKNKHKYLKARWSASASSKNVGSAESGGHILIANATGPTNIGDQAMLVSLLELVSSIYPEKRIVIHSSVPELYTNTTRKRAHRIEHTLYSWAVFSDERVWMRVAKMIDLSIKYFWTRFSIPVQFGFSYSTKLIADYEQADLILFVGGGYLRSQPGLTQSLNVVMQLFMMALAKNVTNPKILAPISFGPFAAAWQEKLAAHVLAGIDVVSVRESFSFQKLQDQGLKKTLLSTDHALFLPSLASDRLDRPSNSQPILGFTIRQWLPPSQQAKFEQAYLEALVGFGQKNTVIFQPIVQVDAPKYGDVDLEITTKIAGELKQHHLKVMPTQRPQTLDQAMRTYANLDLLLGMRMHSNILAATQHVPFVAISYEYKTEGICQQLGMADNVIRCEEVTAAKLEKLLTQALTHRVKLKKQLKQRLAALVKPEQARWLEILAQATIYQYLSRYGSLGAVIGLIWYNTGFEYFVI